MLTHKAQHNDHFKTNLAILNATIATLVAYSEHILKLKMHLHNVAFILAVPFQFAEFQFGERYS